MPIEFTNDKNEKNILQSIILSSDKKDILEISYNKGICLKTSNILPSSTIKRYTYSLNDDNIYLAFKKLCQFNPQKCYDLYQIINNPKYKNLILTAINDVYKEYSKFDSKYNNISYKQNLFKGNIKRDCYEFYTKINTWHASINLNNDNNIIKAIYQKVAVNGVPLIASGYKEYMNDNLTNDIISYISSLLCQGNLEEYQNLLNTLDNKSKEYKNVLNGGKLYTNRIKSLHRELVKK